jgi:hypothetical protein
MSNQAKGNESGRSTVDLRDVFVDAEVADAVNIAAAAILQRRQTGTPDPASEQRAIASDWRRNPQASQGGSRLHVTGLGYPAGRDRALAASQRRNSLHR